MFYLTDLQPCVHNTPHTASSFSINLSHICIIMKVEYCFYSVYIFCNISCWLYHIFMLGLHFIVCFDRDGHAFAAVWLNSGLFLSQVDVVELKFFNVLFLRWNISFISRIFCDFCRNLYPKFASPWASTPCRPQDIGECLTSYCMYMKFLEII